MRFPPSFLDEIRARVPVSEVVGRRVKLQKRGREFVGLSPFTAEKTPSFTVNDQKSFYHCFSSGSHGDIFKFLTEVEGLTFPEAVERLASQAGLDVPQLTPTDIAKEKKRASLYDVMEAAAAFFEAQLQSAQGADALRYLQGRGLRRDTRAAFRLGYAPKGRYGLKEHLTSKGVTQDQMAEAGLLVSGDDIAVSFDRFRERVMFPIPDARGRTIAFGGRALSAEARAKYLNSPETPLFHKGHVLYNYASARKSAHDDGSVIVAEGYMDVIALAAAGFTNAVAPLGTALTDRQVQLLWRLSPNPVLCFDGDKAGVRAAERALDVTLPLLQPGKSLRFAFLPEGQDPDDLIRGEGPGAMAEVLQKARPLVDILWAREKARPLETPEQKAAFEADLNKKIASIADEGVRHHYRQDIRDRLRDLWRGGSGGKNAGNGSFQGKQQAGKRGWNAKNQGWNNLRRTHLGDDRQRRFAKAPDLPEPTADPSLDFALTQEWRHKRLADARSGSSASEFEDHRAATILLALINHPRLIESHAEDIADLDFNASELDRLKQRIIDIAALAPTLEDFALNTHLQEQGFSNVLDKLSRVAATGGDWFAKADAAFEDAETGWRQAVLRQRKANTLSRELAQAEQALGEDMTDENFERLKDAQMALESFEGNEANIDGFGALSGRSRDRGRHG